jgi:phosphohistidine phosphatase SixA
MAQEAAESNQTREVTILVHAEATEWVQGMPHDKEIARGLTPKGKEQAAERNALFKDAPPDLTLVSTAQRSFETGYLAAGLSVTKSRDSLHMLGELAYDGPDTAEGRILADIFLRLGNASLKAYNSLDVGTIEERAGKMWDKVAELVRHYNAQKTLVVGHRPFVAAMGYLLTGGLEGFDRDRIFGDLVWKECWGFTLTFVNDEVAAIRLHFDPDLDNS